MPAANKEETSTAQGRFVVSLPKEVGTQIDEVAKKLSAAFAKETGVAFELSRAQVVQSLVAQALKDALGNGNGDTPAAA